VEALSEIAQYIRTITRSEAQALPHWLMFSAEWDRSKNQLQHEDEAGRAREQGAAGA